MRLTTVLCVIFPKVKKIPGLRLRGKRQAHLKIRTVEKIQAANFMLMEQQNVEQLSNPYLTCEEEEVYGQAFPVDKAKRFADYIQTQERPFFPHRTLKESFDNLNLGKRWE